MTTFNSHKWIKLAKQGRLHEGDPTMAYFDDKKVRKAPSEDESFDWKYFIKQTESLIDTLMEFEQEIGTALEAEGDKSGDSYWKQSENQTSRYIMGAHKQLEGLLKKLETAEKRVGRGIYKI